MSKLFYTGDKKWSVWKPLINLRVKPVLSAVTLISIFPYCHYPYFPTATIHISLLPLSIFPYCHTQLIYVGPHILLPRFVCLSSNGKHVTRHFDNSTFCRRFVCLERQVGTDEIWRSLQLRSSSFRNIAFRHCVIGQWPNKLLDR